MKVLVTFALENEFAPWRKMRNFQKSSGNAGDRSYAVKIGEANVQVFITGVGRFAVQRAAAGAFESAPEVCISSGLAGSLKDSHQIGEVLATRATSDAAGVHLIYSNAELLADAVESGAKRVERFVVSDRVIATAAEKKSLAVLGDAVDMESLYILAEASKRAIPAIAIRAVSDDTSSDLPLDFDRLLNVQGGVSVPKVIGQVISRPQRLGALLRLARHSARAASALARFLDVYVQDISHDPLFEISKAAAVAI
jgi:adenosylhomocysteine nucleosidase